LKGTSHKHSRLETKILEEVSEKRGEMIGFLQSLVRIPSVVGKEGDVQKFIEKKFRSLNLAVDVWEPDLKQLKKHPAYFRTTSCAKFGYKGRPNVVGKLKGSGQSRSLMLAGHVDVVSCEPVKEWKRDPWGAEIVGNKLYGRGSADMKGGIASMVYAIESVLESGVRPKGDITVAATIEEEDGGIGGALATILKGYRADAVINPEPMGDYEIGIASAGVMYFRVKIVGKSAHAATAHFGVNAIDKILQIHEALTELNQKRQATIRYAPAETSPEMKGHVTTINTGRIFGGDWPSTVAGWAEMECRVGWPPGEQLEDVKKEIEHTIEKVAKRDSWLRYHPPVVEWFGWRAEPHEQNPQHPFVQGVSKLIQDMTRKKPTLVGGDAGLDTRFFVRYANIPAITLGPKGFNLHSIDEHVDIDSVVETAKIIALTIVRWCGLNVYSSP
jgi:acetylornithine deacetylase